MSSQHSSMTTRRRIGCPSGMAITVAAPCLPPDPRVCSLFDHLLARAVAQADSNRRGPTSLKYADNIEESSLIVHRSNRGQVSPDPHHGRLFCERQQHRQDRQRKTVHKTTAQNVRMSSSGHVSGKSFRVMFGHSGIIDSGREQVDDLPRDFDHNVTAKPMIRRDRSTFESERIQDMDTSQPALLKTMDFVKSIESSQVISEDTATSPEGAQRSACRPQVISNIGLDWIPHFMSSGSSNLEFEQSENSIRHRRKRSRRVGRISDQIHMQPSRARRTRSSTSREIQNADAELKASGSDGAQSSEPNRYQCMLCGEVCQTRQLTRRHILVVHVPEISAQLYAEPQARAANVEGESRSLLPFSSYSYGSQRRALTGSDKYSDKY